MTNNIFETKELENIYDFLRKKYINIISINIKNIIKLILNENDLDNKNIFIEELKKRFNLTNSQINEYILVVNLEVLYIEIISSIKTIIELHLENDISFNEMNEEIKEIEEKQKEFFKIFEQYQKNISKNESTTNNSSYNNLSFVSNFILFLSDTESDRICNIESKSGLKEISMTKITNEIKVLMNSNFEILRSKRKIHQINDSKGQIVFTKYKLAYERFGTGTTKISYIRIPICKNNIELLNQKFKNYDWRYLILIIGFGDFKNEGISEKKLYDRFRKKALENINEIESIIKIFNEPFNEETFNLATNMIENGFSNIQILENTPEKSLINNELNLDEKKVL